MCSCAARYHARSCDRPQELVVVPTRLTTHRSDSPDKEWQSIPDCPCFIAEHLALVLFFSLLEIQVRKVGFPSGAKVHIPIPLIETRDIDTGKDMLRYVVNHSRAE
jgi:hypothetical protein